MWSISAREYVALRDVHTTIIQRWALEQAMFANAHFRGKDDAAYEPIDFMGGGDRESRTRKAQRDAFEVAKMNFELNKITKGSPTPTGLHPVFVGEYWGGADGR